MTDWVPFLERGLSAPQHAAALLDFSMPPFGTCCPAWPGSLQYMIGLKAPRAMGQDSLRSGETRAVNQEARTTTPEEAETLPMVNSHRNSHLLNLERHEGWWERERTPEPNENVSLPYMHQLSLLWPQYLIGSLKHVAFRIYGYLSKIHMQY